MKSYLAKQSKKVFSILMSVLMILSCWVWVAPAAEAVDPGLPTYRFTLTYECTDDQDDNEVDINCYLYYQDLYGSLKKFDLGATSSWITSKCTKVFTESSVSGWRAGYRPMYATFYHRRMSGTVSRSAAASLRLQVYDYDGTVFFDSGECSDSAASKETNLAMNTSRGTGYITDTSMGTNVPQYAYYTYYNIPDEDAYSAGAAVEYARRYALSYNKEWYFYSDGGDCANFLSQCLYAGGIKMDAKWFSFDWNPNGYRYYKFDENKNIYTWIRANELRNYLISIGGTQILHPQESDFSLGDAVFYDWDYDGKADHSAIVTAIDNGVPKVSAHTSAESASKLDFHWTYGNNPDSCILVKLHGETCVNTAESYVGYRVDSDAQVYGVSKSLTGVYSLVLDYGENDAFQLNGVPHVIGQLRSYSTVRVTNTFTSGGVTYGVFNYFGTDGCVDLAGCTQTGSFDKIEENHNMGDWQLISAATCTKGAVYERYCSKCDFYVRLEERAAHLGAVPATCTTSGYCTVCGEVYSAPLGHSMSAWHTETEATCTVAGADKRECSRCSYYETREIAPKGHITQTAATGMISFGSYPQSQVKDEQLLSSLNALTLTWKSFGYYSGNGSFGSMTKQDTMQYADVTYNGQKYRAVTFSQYRPTGTHRSSSAANSYQDDNGYQLNTVYWFRYDPIRWRVLDDETGLVMTEALIDSQPFSNLVYYDSSKTSPYQYFNDSANTQYANDYATSSLRTWLNEDFYNTAFTDAQKANILTSSLTTKCRYADYPDFDSVSTQDKVFVLSYEEANSKAYGFTKAQGTEYAMCQGVRVWDYSTASALEKLFYKEDGNGNCYWWLRSASSNSKYSYHVHSNGNFASGCNDGVADAFEGVRPAMTLDINSSAFINKDPDIEPTCTEDGKYGAVYCVVCGEKAVDEVKRDAIGHKWDEGQTVSQQTCTTDGVVQYTCENEPTHTKTEILPATGHKGGAAVIENMVDATCDTAGSYDEVVYCTNPDRTKTDGEKITDKGGVLYQTFKWLFDDMFDTLTTYADSVTDPEELLNNVLGAISDSSAVFGQLAETLCSDPENAKVMLNAFTDSIGSLEALLDSPEFAAIVEPILPDGLGKWTYTYTLDGVTYVGTEDVPYDNASDIETLRQLFIDSVHKFFYNGKALSEFMYLFYPVLSERMSDKYLGTIDDTIDNWALSVITNNWGIGDMFRFLLAGHMPTLPHQLVSSSDYSRFFADYPAVLQSLSTATTFKDSFNESNGASAWNPGSFRSGAYADDDGWDDGAHCNYVIVAPGESGGNGYSMDWSPIMGENAKAAWHIKDSGSMINALTACLSGVGVPTALLTARGGEDIRFAGIKTGTVAGTLNISLKNNGSLYDQIIVPIYQLLGLKEMNTSGTLMSGYYYSEDSIFAAAKNALNDFENQNSFGGGNFDRLVQMLFAPIVDWFNQILFTSPLSTIASILPGVLDAIENDTIASKLPYVSYSISEMDILGFIDMAGLMEDIRTVNLRDIFDPNTVLPFYRGVNGILRALIGAQPVNEAPADAEGEVFAARSGKYFTKDYLVDPDGNAVYFNGSYWLKAASTDEYSSMLSYSQKLCDFMGYENYLAWITSNGVRDTLFNVPVNDFIAWNGCACGAELSRRTVVIPAKGHDLVKKEAKAATCTANGNIEYYKCKTCSAFFADENAVLSLSSDQIVLNALGHDFAEKITDDAHLVSAADCTNAAVYKYDCTRCGAMSEELTYSFGEALGHDWDDGIPQPDATCNSEGLMLYTCKRDAAHTYTAVIDMKDHRRADPVMENVVEADCETAGSYESVEYCADCRAECSRQKVTVNALTHDLIKTEAKAADCLNDGNIEYYTCGREGCGKIFSDSQANNRITEADIVIKALGHDHTGSFTVTAKATCTTAGEKKLFCARESCGELISTVAIQPAAHNMGEWTVTQAATCTQDGSRTRSCLNTTSSDEYEACSYTETEVIYAQGHNIVKVNRVEATCETDGNIEYYKCANDGCDKLFADVEGKTEISAADVVLPATGHKSEYNNGETFTFGSYPQSKVTDEAVLEQLNAAQLNWKSYQYYSGSEDYGTMTDGDYMKYADVELDGVKYRAVQFSLYRPQLTYSANSAERSLQDDNGYVTGETYWFRYEPLVWRMLDKENGLAMCESIIDAQAYNNKVYFDDDIGYWIEDVTTLSEEDEAHAAKYYPTSSIREWLNSTLYDTAFTKQEKAAISLSELSEDKSFSDYVFLLSRPDARNKEYGFGNTTVIGSSDESKMAIGTDYAKAQGLYVSTAKETLGRSSWSLRNFAGTDSVMYGVSAAGVVFNMMLTEDSSIGIRPAVKLNMDLLKHTSYQDPTCTEDGYTGDICCVSCGKVLEEGEKIDKLGHDFGEWTVDTPATCEQTGTKSRTCGRTDCGFKEEETLTALGHNYVLNTEVSVKATCTEDGFDYYECTNNPAHSYKEVVTATGHDLTEWVDNAPEKGCGQGVRTRSCTKADCDFVEEDFYFIDHDYCDEVVVAPTCVSDGYSYVVCRTCNDVRMLSSAEALGHDFQRDEARDKALSCTQNGVEAYTCSRCDETNDTVTFASGHSLSPLDAGYAASDDKMECISSVPVTCGDGTGKVEVYQCTHTVNGVRCDYTVNVGQQNDHEMGEWYEAEKAGCVNDGLMQRDCAKGDYSEYKVIPATGHNYVVTSSTDSDCVNEGQIVETCTNCSTQIITPVSAKGHILIRTNAVDATCLDDGNIEYYTCIREGCSGIYSDSEAKNEITDEKDLVVEKLGHDDSGEYTVITKGTCTTDGEKKLYCIRVNADTECGELIKTETIAARGHSFGEWYTVEEADCETAGLERRDCQNAADDEYEACSEYETRTIDPKGHTPGTPVTENKVEATCEEKGSYDEVVYCEVCKTELSREAKEIAAKGHIPGEMTVVKKASCTEDGLRQQQCTECTAILDSEVIPAKGHTFSDWSDTKEATCIAKGEQKRTCTNTGDDAYEACDFFETQETAIDPNNHALVHHDAKEATCEENGWKAYDTCAREGCTYSTYEDDIATGHTPTIVNAKKATDKIAGYTGDTVCSKCGKVFKTGAIIPAGSTLLPEDYPDLESGKFVHRNNGKNWDFWYENETFVNGTEFVVADITDGDDYDYCSSKNKNGKFKLFDLKAQCGEMMVQPNGDIWIALNVPGNFDPNNTVICYVNSATGQYEKMPCFVKDGKIYFRTNHFSSYAVVEQGCAHSYASQTRPATCTVDGVITFTCTKCSYSYTEVIKATGHIDVNDDGICDKCSTNLRPVDPSASCSHMCHKGGFVGFIWKIVCFFCKLFGTNQVCSCGKAHY